MKNFLLIGFVFIAGAASCRSTSATSSEPAASSSTMAAPMPLTPPMASAQASLDRLDTRLPVPLLPMMANHQKQNMRDHLVAVRDVVSGIGATDFHAIEDAAKRMGYSEQMGQMCTHMGAEAPGFTERALAFHHTADTIGEAARAHDMSRVLSALSQTMATCTACHAMFKQQIVDELSPHDARH